MLLGRLTALLRALMPGMAGMSGMRYRTFFVWNAAGGVMWGAGCVLLGYAFASALSTVERYLTWAPVAVFSVLLVGWLGLKVRERRRNAAEKAALVSVTGDREPEVVET